jgi:hypothetical protein
MDVIREDAQNVDMENVQKKDAIVGVIAYFVLRKDFVTNIVTNVILNVGFVGQFPIHLMR